MSELVYVLLPVHNRKRLTLSFVDCLISQTYRNYHLVLIDDGSTDGTSEAVTEKLPGTTVISGRGDWWWAGSLQQGIEWLNTNAGSMNDAVLFINDDVTFDGDFLEQGLSELRAEPNAWICAQIRSQHTGEILNEGQIYDAATLTFRNPMPGEPINCVSTNGLMMRVESLGKVGGFFPRLLPHYLSDYEFTIRATRSGVVLKCIAEFRLWWNEETTGLRNFDNHSFWTFLRLYFSKKSAINPVYWTTFVLLTCRPSIIPWQILRIWRSACKQILLHAVRCARWHLSK